MKRERKRRAMVAEEPDPVKVFEELSDKFFVLRQHRMQQTNQEDMFSFLGDDVIMSMMELLADISNYCDKQFIKLAMLQDFLRSDLDKKGVVDEGLKFGLKGFQRSSEAWKDNKS